MRSQGERNEQKIRAEQERRREAALVHVKSSWREEEVYVASGNHFSVVHGAGSGWGGEGGVFAHIHTHTHDTPSLFQLQVSGPRASPHTGHEQVRLCCRAVSRERLNLLGRGGQEPQCVCVLVLMRFLGGN